MTATGNAAAGRPAPIRPIEDRIAATDCLIRLLATGSMPANVSLSPARWDAFVEEAARHRIGALVWRRLDDSGAGRVPVDVIERLRSHYVRNAFRNAVLFRETANVAAALAAEAIPVMVLKGLHLARLVYEEPALRSMADIDLMVPRDRIEDADRILVAMGYGPLPRPDIPAHCAWSNHLPALVKTGCETVEIHYDIERPTSPFAIDPAELWQSARSSTLEGQEIVTLSNEHLLLHLCLHLAYHHRFERAALKGLVDVAILIRRCAIDWDIVVSTANRWQAGAFVYATLRLARDVLEANVPGSAMDALDHDGHDDEAVAVAHRYILTPAVDVSASIVEIQRTQGGPRRIALFLEAVFLPPSRLREIYGLAPASPAVWLYYPVRIFDLIRRTGGLLARIAVRTDDVRPVRDRERDRRLIRQWAGYEDPRALPDRQSQSTRTPRT